MLCMSETSEIIIIFNIHDGMAEKPYVPAIQNFFRIENPLTICSSTPLVWFWACYSAKFSGEHLR